MNLSYLIMSFRENCKYGNDWLVAMQYNGGNLEQREDILRERGFLSGRVIEDERSPYKGCGEGRYILEEGDELVVRKVVTTHGGNELDNAYRLLQSESGDIAHQRRTITRPAIGTLVKEMIALPWWCSNKPDNDDEISRLVDKIVQRYLALKAAKHNLTFKFRPDIVQAYLEWHPFSCSCMTGPSRSDNTEVYERTLGGTRMYAVEAREGPNDDDRFVGRCLVYKPSTKNTVAAILGDSIEEGDVPWNEGAEGWRVSRIYGNCSINAGGDTDGIRLFKGSLMKQYPWLIHDKAGFVPAKIPSSTRLPYLDNGGSFIVNHRDPGSKIILSMGEETPDGGWEVEAGSCYEGGFIYNSDSTCRCYHCEDRIHADDANYINDEPVCECCTGERYTWCTVSDCYVDNDSTIKIVSGPLADEYVDRDALPFNRRNHEYILALDVYRDEVAACIDDCVECWVDGDETYVYVDSDRDRAMIVEAKIVRVRFDSFGHLSSSLAVTDETVKVLKYGNRNGHDGRLFMGMDGEYYYSDRMKIEIGGNVQCLPTNNSGEPFITLFRDGSTVSLVSSGGLASISAVVIGADHNFVTRCMEDTIERRITTAHVSQTEENVAWVHYGYISTTANTREDMARTHMQLAMGSYSGGDAAMGDLYVSHVTDQITNSNVVSVIKLMHRSRRFFNGRYRITNIDNDKFKVESMSRPIFGIIGNCAIIDISTHEVRSA